MMQRNALKPVNQRATTKVATRPRAETIPLWPAALTTVIGVALLTLI